MFFVSGGGLVYGRFRNISFTLPALATLSCLLSVPSPLRALVNGGFETGDLTGWQQMYFYGASAADAQSGDVTDAASTFTGSTTPPAVTSIMSPYADAVPAAQIANGIVPAQANPAWGTNGGLTLPFAGNYCGQIFSGSGSPHGYAAWLYQSDTVPSTNCCLMADMAAVLEGAHYLEGNPYDSDAYVELQVTLGSVNGPIIYSVRYSWYDNLNSLQPNGLVGVPPGWTAGNGVPIFGDVTGNFSCDDLCAGNPGNGPYKYLPWTPQSFNLCAYAGQTVTLSYYAVSCYESSHSAFGYIDNVGWNVCNPPTLTLSKSVSPAGPVPPGSTLTYTLSAYNFSTSTAMSGLSICDSIPTGVELMTSCAAGSGGPCIQPCSASSACGGPNAMLSDPPGYPVTYTGTDPGDSICWSVDSLAPGATDSFSFMVVVQAPSPGVCSELIANTGYESNISSAGTSSNAVSITVQVCSPTITNTGSATPTATQTVSYSSTPTASPSPTHTPSFTITPTFTPTPLPLLLTPHFPNPNPANGAGIWLPYSISTPSWVDVEVYDVAGERVRGFDTDPDFEQAGDYERYWDERNASGAQAASGIFLVRIHARDPRNEEATVWEKCAVVR